jgi:hypothetical protein
MDGRNGFISSRSQAYMRIRLYRGRRELGPMGIWDGLSKLG